MQDPSVTELQETNQTCEDMKDDKGVPQLFEQQHSVENTRMILCKTHQSLDFRRQINPVRIWKMIRGHHNYLNSRKILRIIFKTLPSLNFRRQVDPGGKPQLIKRHYGDMEQTHHSDDITAHEKICKTHHLIQHFLNKM